MRSSLITGLSGLVLTADEAAFLRDARPCGLIVFARNIASPDQLKRLIADARDAIGAEDTLALVDQEGGRVQRMGPPHWLVLPPARAFSTIYREDPEAASAAALAAYNVARYCAETLRAVGLDTNCAPVLDVPVAGAHDIIGDRAYADNPADVAMLAVAVADGLTDGAVLPVIKHIPGHGRATADSHLALPVVTTPLDELEASDFQAFRSLADRPAAMTAHVVFTAIDDGEPASTSRRVIEAIVRASIGFDGFLMSDDLSMKALAGSIAMRAEAVIAAGCDVALHCNGDLSEMQAAAGAVPHLQGAALRRFERAVAVTRRAPVPYDCDAALAMIGDLVGAGA